MTVWPFNPIGTSLFPIPEDDTLPSPPRCFGERLSIVLEEDPFSSGDDSEVIYAPPPSPAAAVPSLFKEVQDGLRRLFFRE
jgi:hypothetical protein